MPTPPTDRAEQAAAVAPGAFSALLRELVAPTQPRSGGAPAFHPGQVIGRFELLREIGRGGFGVVYEARDRQLLRSVAFKAVLAAGAPGVREERLLREAELAARLSHPNIVTLYDVGRSDAGAYLVLELLRGQTLAHRLEAGALPLRETLRIAVAVAEGLAHAHAQGVVHRDLTPNNIFLCDDGQVKVLDFGMAHAFGRRRLDGGTRAYMAPEQRSGAPEDERTDVFAFGVVLYQALAGELPFGGGEAQESASVAPRIEVVEAPRLGELVGRMLDVDPVRRPRDAGEVLPALAGSQRALARGPSVDLPTVRTRRGGAERSPSAAAAVPSIAVLPFADMSQRHDQEYFSDGVAEEIQNALAHVEGLRVAGRTSSFFFKGKSIELAEIGRRLNVASVLDGSVRKEGNRVRVTAQLVNVADGYQVWSQTFERELSCIFALQDEIAQTVAAGLKVNLRPGRGAVDMGYGTSNIEAYNQYLLGKQFRRRGDNRHTLSQAVERFERALALDPSYAPAWSGLAEALYFLGDYAETLADLLDLQQRALAAAEKAVALGPRIPDGYSQRGRLRATLSWDWSGADADLERARALSPADGWSQRNRGVLLSYLGRQSEAVSAMRDATDLDPLDARAWNNLGWNLLAMGELAEARSAFSRAQELTPESVTLSFHLGLASLLEGDPANARAVFERNPVESNRLIGAALAGFASGDVGGSRAALEALVARFAHAHPYEIAQVCAWCGDGDRAFEWLARAAAVHDRNLPDVKIDPLLRNVRGDPRYTALLREMDLPVE